MNASIQCRLVVPDARPTRCPDHQSVAGILQCQRCAAIFWGKQARRRQLDEDGQRTREEML